MVQLCIYTNVDYKPLFDTLDFGNAAANPNVISGPLSEKCPRVGTFPFVSEKNMKITLN